MSVDLPEPVRPHTPTFSPPATLAGTKSPSWVRSERQKTKPILPCDGAVMSQGRQVRVCRHE
jgi:hypothetical protein